MATKLTHIRLLTSDVHRLADFYQEGFGFEKTLDIAEGFYVEVSAGEVVIGIYRRDLMDSITGQPAPGPGDRTVLCIAVDDVDAAHHRLVLNGAEEVTGPHDREDWFLRVAHVRDPDGNLLEVNKSTFAGS